MISTADLNLYDCSTAVIEVPRAGGGVLVDTGPAPTAGPGSKSVSIGAASAIEVPWTVDSAWKAYLLRLADEPIGRTVATFWERVQRTERGLPPPTALRSEDGSMHLAWDRDVHHLDVDLRADGTFEWFYRNRLTDELDGTDEERVAGVPEVFAARLRLLAG